MKFHYKGKYSGNPEELPHLEHEPGAVAFREPENAAALGRIASVIAIILLIITFVLIYLRAGEFYWQIVVLVPYLVSLIPHEFLHALCFREDVYMYTNLQHGMLFVVGPERMSKGRFVFMSLLPNIVFGFIPFLIYMIHPQFRLLGLFAGLSIPSGAGDYLNVYHALTQMPKGARTYLHKFNSFWYIP